MGFEGKCAALSTKVRCYGQNAAVILVILVLADLEEGETGWLRNDGPVMEEEWPVDTTATSLQFGFQDCIPDDSSEESVVCLTTREIILVGLVGGTRRNKHARVGGGVACRDLS